MTYFWMSLFFSISVENQYMLLGKEHIDASILLHPNMSGGEGNRVQILNSPGLRFVTLVMYFSWRTLSFLSYKV